VQRRLWSEEKGLSPGPEVWLSRAGSQCLRYWERWLSPARRRVAAHVRSVRHARVNPELLGSLKSQGFRCQYEGFCQASAPFAASHPASRSASKVVSYSQLGGQGSAHLSLHLESRHLPSGIIPVQLVQFSFIFKSDWGPNP